MKNYVVALISFFDNDIKQLKVSAESEYEAVKKAVIEFTSEEYKQSEIDFQNSEDYPKDIESLDEHFSNIEMDFSVIEI
jgi:DNA-binding protein